MMDGEPFWYRGKVIGIWNRRSKILFVNPQHQQEIFAAMTAGRRWGWEQIAGVLFSAAVPAEFEVEAPEMPATIFGVPVVERHISLDDLWWDYHRRTRLDRLRKIGLLAGVNNN